MLVVVHAAAIKESPLEVEAEAGSRCDCSDKSRLITHAIIKNHRVGVCWFWRGLSTLIVHNCTGCHLRCAGSGAISALWASFDSESRGKKKTGFDHEISTINVGAFPLWSEKAVMAAVCRCWFVLCWHRSSDYEHHKPHLGGPELRPCLCTL